MRTLILARHGETDWNLAGRWQGATDVPLNATGREQARALAARVQALEPCAVVASDLGRALETARIVAAELGLPGPLADRALRERSYGVFEGLTRAECEACHPDAWEAFTRGVDPPGSEPRAAVGRRMIEAVTRLVIEHAGRVLVVSHGGSLRAFFEHATGVRVPPLGNAALYEVRWSGERFSDPRIL